MSEYTCRFCGAALKYIFIDMGMYPPASNYCPRRAYVCGNCFLVQMPVFAIYGAHFSCISESLLSHGADYSEKVIKRFGIIPSSTVIEIASNDGCLLRNFKEKGIPVLGIEPARNAAEAAAAGGVPTLVESFDARLAKELRREGIMANLLIGNNVLPDVPDINDFVHGLKTILHPEGVITMEFPHLMRLMRLALSGTIHCGHFSFFSLLTVEKIFAAHGLLLFDVEELPAHGGSLRIYARHASGASWPAERRSLRVLREKERKAGFNDINFYLDFAKRAAGAGRNAEVMQ